MDKGKWILVGVLFATTVVAVIVANVIAKKVPALNK